MKWRREGRRWSCLAVLVGGVSEEGEKEWEGGEEREGEREMRK